MIFKIAICDDSQDYCEIVKELINIVMLQNNLSFNIFTYNSGKELVQEFKELNFNLIFLDMEMPGLSGIETGLLIRELSNDAVIIYLTSHKGYAFESYQVKAKDYLLKPVSLELIEKVLLEYIKDNQENIRFLDVKDVNGIKHRIPIDEITHILRKKEDRKLHIMTIDNKSIVVVQTLESIEKELSTCDNIARSSKSCLINMKNVRTIISNNIYFCNGAVEYASRRCLPVLISKLNIL